jgi:hypothetical protein
LNRGYLLAAEKSDVAWYAEHLAEDCRATNPDGSFVDKAGFLARIGRSHPVTGFRAPEVSIQRVGDVALIHASFEDTRPDGSHGRGRYREHLGRAPAQRPSRAGHRPPPGEASHEGRVPEGEAENRPRSRGPGAQDTRGRGQQAVSAGRWPSRAACEDVETDSHGDR